MRQVVFSFMLCSFLLSQIHATGGGAGTPLKSSGSTSTNLPPVVVKSDPTPFIQQSFTLGYKAAAVSLGMGALLQQVRNSIAFHGYTLIQESLLKALGANGTINGMASLKNPNGAQIVDAWTSGVKAAAADVERIQSSSSSSTTGARSSPSLLSSSISKSNLPNLLNDLCSVLIQGSQLKYADPVEYTNITSKQFDLTPRGNGNGSLLVDDIPSVVNSFIQSLNQSGLLIH